MNGPSKGNAASKQEWLDYIEWCAHAERMPRTYPYLALRFVRGSYDYATGKPRRPTSHSYLATRAKVSERAAGEFLRTCVAQGALWRVGAVRQSGARYGKPTPVYWLTVPGWWRKRRDHAPAAEPAPVATHDGAGILAGLEDANAAADWLSGS